MLATVRACHCLHELPALPFHRFFGGSLYVDGLTNFTCEGATFRGNHAGDQGGGVYARHTIYVNNSCDFIDNESPQGAALYIASAESVALEDHDIADKVAYSRGVVYVASSFVSASRVTFKSSATFEEGSPNRAVQSERKSTLMFKECVFDGWLGDTVINHENPKPESLALESCDFGRSSPIMAVSSLTSDAKIRNAIVGDLTFANAGRLNYSKPLVDQALNCNSPNICGPGKCVDSTLGVLCECLDADTCLSDFGELSVDVKTHPASETYSPDPVSFELLVSLKGDGTEYAIWNLMFEAEDIKLDVVPSSGILPAGGNVTVVVTGTVATQDMGGNLTSNFILTSAGRNNSSSNAAMRTLAVNSTYYLCLAHQFAEPGNADNKSFVCKSCFEIGDEGEGVNCDNAGVTLVSLPIREGYWRSSNMSQAVHKCGHSGACIAATDILSSDGYCANGYRGPCESTDGSYAS